MIFVPGAAPGDRVRVRVVEQHGNYARAALVHRCAARHRRTASRRARGSATCGGCPWQHVAYATQLAAKEQNVRESLAAHRRRHAGALAADHRRARRMGLPPSHPAAHRAPAARSAIAGRARTSWSRSSTA